MPISFASRREAAQRRPRPSRPRWSRAECKWWWSSRSSLCQRLIETLRRHAAKQFSVHRDRRRARAIAEAIDRIEGIYAVWRVSPKSHPRRSFICSASATAPIAWHDSARHTLMIFFPRRMMTEVVVERHHAMDLGARKIKDFAMTGTAPAGTHPSVSCTRRRTTIKAPGLCFSCRRCARPRPDPNCARYP